MFNEGRLPLVAMDVCRVRLESILVQALDAGMRGDSLYVPMRYSLISRAGESSLCISELRFRIMEK